MQKENKRIEQSDALKGFLFRTYHANRFKTTGVEDPEQQPLSNTIMNGFTLIELLVVVLIIGILAAIALPRYQQAIYKSRFMSIIPVVKALEQSAHAYYLEHGNYTNNIFAYDFQYPDCQSSQTTWCQTNTYAQFHVFKYTTQDKKWWVRGSVMKENGESINSYQICLDCAEKRVLCGARSGNKLAEKVCTSLGGVKDKNGGGYCSSATSWCGFYVLP